MGETVRIHCNRSLIHQVKHGEVFKKGFERHGYDVSVSYSPEGEADIHVISGPHFAKDRWLGHPRTILIDRCYYRGDPDHVSLGWMTPEGGRRWAMGEGRASPEPKPIRRNDRSIYLMDYKGPEYYGADTTRYHPAQLTPKWTLEQDLANHGIAMGYVTTALCTAALEGLRIICKSPKSIMYQPNWLDLLPYADWSHDEIESGEAVEFLMETE